jgi:hypothetical protein
MVWFFDLESVSSPPTLLFSPLFSTKPVSPLAVTTTTAQNLQFTYTAPMLPSYSLAVFWNGTQLSDSPYIYQTFAPIEIQPAHQLAALVMGIICIAFCIGAMIALQYLWSRPVIKAGSPFFLSLMLVGCIILSVGIVIRGLELSPLVCTSSSWLMSIGFIIANTSLLVKAYRIKNIFLNKTLKNAFIPDHKLLIPIFVLVVAECIFHTARLILDPYAIAVLSLPSNAILQYHSCGKFDVLCVYIGGGGGSSAHNCYLLFTFLLMVVNLFCMIVCCSLLSLILFVSAYFVSVIPLFLLWNLVICQIVFFFLILYHTLSLSIY